MSERPRESRKEKFYIIKWDLITNLLVCAGWMYEREWKGWAYFVLSLIFLSSYFMFHYKGPWVPVTMYVITGVFFIWHYINPWEIIDNALWFGSWGLFIYSTFWILIAYKNYRKYLKSLEPDLCPICGKYEDDEMVIYLDMRMCQDCFNEGIFLVRNYDGIELNYWSYEYLDELEKLLHHQVPFYTQIEQKFPINNSNNFGYGSNEHRITHLYLANQDLGELPLAIGSLSELEILDLKNNNLSTIPVSIQQLKKLKIIDIRENPLDKIGREANLALKILRDNGCEILGYTVA